MLGTVLVADLLFKVFIIGIYQHEKSVPADIRRNIAMKSKSKNRLKVFVAVGATLSLWIMGCQSQEQSQKRPPKRTPEVSVVAVSTQPVTLTTECRTDVGVSGR